jgi:hypothetical protein
MPTRHEHDAVIIDQSTKQAEPFAAMPPSFGPTPG